MRKPAPNQAVAELLRRHKGPSAVARATGASKGTVGKWFEGKTKPPEERRALIAEKLKVPGRLWDLAPEVVESAHGDNPPEAAPLLLAPVEPVDCEAPGATKAVIIAQVRRLRADVMQLRTDPETPRATIERAEDQLRKAALALAKASGEFAPTEVARIVRSPQWRRLRDEILGALSAWPAALEDLQNVFAELEDCV